MQGPPLFLFELTWPHLSLTSALEALLETLLILPERLYSVGQHKAIIPEIPGLFS